MQSSSAFLYAEWAGRLGFLLLEYDCRMVPIILRRTVRFTTIVVGLGLSWLACRRINCLPLAAAPHLPEDFGSGENSQQFNFLLTRGRPKVESRIVSMRMGSSRQLRPPPNRGCRYNALSQAPAAGYHSSFVPASSSRCVRASLSLKETRSVR